MADDANARDARGPDADSADGGTGYWYNPRTNEVEEGRLSPWGDRMGPYATRAEAERALETAASRSEAWDEADRRWKDDDWPDGDG